jgi:predicted ATPase
MLAASLFNAGDLLQAKEHLNHGIELYDRGDDLHLATRFSIDSRVFLLVTRSLVLWTLGYPAAAGNDAEQAITHARDVGQPAAWMLALGYVAHTYSLLGNYSPACALADELVAAAEKNNVVFWNGFGRAAQALLLALTGKNAEAVRVINSAIATDRTTGATVFTPLWLSSLAKAYADLGQFDDAWRCADETKRVVGDTSERWCEAEIERIAGEITLKSPKSDAAKAEEYFERALAVARQQQAKSWELRASMSLARLWRDQGKQQQARELLAPVYGWFTEGFDTLDLKDAKALLEELAS